MANLFMVFVTSLLGLSMMTTPTNYIVDMQVDRVLIMSNEVALISESGDVFLWESDYYMEYTVGQEVTVLMDNKGTTAAEDDEIITILN